ncbi:MAG: small multi-drug export protein [Oscillospiraceae bacterium]|nr:small multi-drug export protein [Oscillospiraceae bacterium]
MKDAIIEFFKPYGPIAVFIVSMIPIVELRGAIPFVGLPLGLAFWQNYLLAVAGNLAPVPIILLFVRKVFDFMRKYEKPRKLVERFEARFVRKAEKMKGVTFWSLVFFVAIPLPVTGAWTGAGIASIFEMRFRDAMLAVTLGVMIAGVIVTAISYGVLGFMNFLI